MNLTCEVLGVQESKLLDTHVTTVAVFLAFRLFLAISPVYTYTGVAFLAFRLFLRIRPVWTYAPVPSVLYVKVRSGTQTPL